MERLALARTFTWAEVAQPALLWDPLQAGFQGSKEAEESSPGNSAAPLTPHHPWGPHSHFVHERRQGPLLGARCRSSWGGSTIAAARVLLSRSDGIACQVTPYPCQAHSTSWSGPVKCTGRPCTFSPGSWPLSVSRRASAPGTGTAPWSLLEPTFPPAAPSKP